MTSNLNFLELVNEAPKLPVRKTIRWQGGLPSLTNKEIISKPGVQKLLEVVMSMDYEGEGDPKGLEPELFGHSKMEVMMLRLARKAAAGDEWAVKLVTERLLGKPKQTTENINANLTFDNYPDFLEAVGVNVVDAELLEQGTETAENTP